MKSDTRKHWTLVAGLGVVVVIAVVVVWVTLVSPQNLTVCPSGCSFSRIQLALDAARRGSRLQIEAGTYREDVQITKPLQVVGTAGALLEGQVTVAKTENVSITALAVRGAVRIQESRNVTIQESTVSDSPDAGIALVRSTEIALQKNIIKNNQGAGVAISQGSAAVLTENIITANGLDGLLIEGSQAHLQKNIIGGNKGYGIHADSVAQLSGEGNRNGYRVPEDFQTIQQALDAWQIGMGANSLGDVSEGVSPNLLRGDGAILVSPGVYKEHLIVREKSLKIRGASREDVILDGTGLGDVDGITIRGESRVTVENLTVRNFRDDGLDAEGKIELVLRNVVLEGNGSTGAEIAHTDVKAWLMQSVMRGNRNYGLWALNAENIAECRGNTITDNGSNYGALDGAQAEAIAQKCQ